MICYLNGIFLPEEQASVSIHDRSFRYGDGLFETVLVANGRCFRWDRHLHRLQNSAALLHLPFPCPVEQLRCAAAELISANELSNALLRVQISRGSGPRGYAPDGTESPLVLMTLHPRPNQPAGTWKLITSSVRLSPGDPLNGIKSSSRLPYVLAAMEARESGADEALLTNTLGQYCEGSSSNLFWIANDSLKTPPASAGLLPGLTRNLVMEISQQLEVKCSEQAASSEDLLRSQGVFLTLSSRGLVNATSLDDRPLAVSPLVGQLQAAWEELVQQECA